jgi:hypothetical protein
MRIQKKNLNNSFIYGNSGDVFTEEIIKQYYKKFTDKLTIENISSEGKRLLIIGSIGHRVMPGDILCGVGIKDKMLPDPRNTPCKIIGLRGPISYELFKRAGYDLSEVEFLMDPGLLIKYYVDTKKPIKPKGAAFIPHYRERNAYKSKRNKGLKYIDIDNCATNIAEQILASELVYSSSLHGIIFSHALNRPCVFVKPQTSEPLIKFQDYYESMNIRMPAPISSIEKISFINAPISPPDLKFKKKDFIFPELSVLKKNKICITK